MKRFLMVLGGLTLAVIGGIFTLMGWFFISMPDVDRLKTCFTTEMYKIKLCEGSSDYVSLDKISPYLVGAVVMSEDAAFFGHEGIDINEIRESFIRNINEGRYARGGSTITQQLAKNIFLSNEKSILRKLQEIYLAFQIEKKLTKDKILTLYLNVVEFGPEIFGIKKASSYYFHKSPIDILPEEAAFLAFLLPSPKKYSESFRKKQLSAFAYKSVRTILHKMLLGKKIQESEYTIAQARVGGLFGGKSESFPSISEEALDQLVEQEENQNSEREGDFKYESDSPELIQ